jgi:hypothetical protein
MLFLKIKFFKALKQVAGRPGLKYKATLINIPGIGVTITYLLFNYYKLFSFLVLSLLVVLVFF